MNAFPLLLIPLFLNFNFSDMMLEDDAFHSHIPFHIETWYFEAMDDEKSIVFMITCAGKFLMIGVQVYQNGILLYDDRRIHTSFYISDKVPLLYIKGEKIMEGFMRDGKIFYKISYSIPSLLISMKFENKSRGWKSIKWIAIPNMKARCIACFNGNNISIDGKGYHDHNIFYPFHPFFHTGYIDGKIIWRNISIVWAKLMDIFHTQTFAIYSNSSYNVMDARIECSNFFFHNGCHVPTSFSIHGKNFGITMYAIGIHFIRLPFIHYWRYHFITRGEIDGKKIKTYDIGEYMLFRYDALP